jgi:FtsZ-binding cell division protein ZapB
MISLEQIRLLEQKVTSAVELIRVLKEENSTLRRGLDSAQRRMKELETLVEGFKTDQREIESAIVRTLRTLDDLEESAAARAAAAAGSAAASSSAVAHGAAPARVEAASRHAEAAIPKTPPPAAPVAEARHATGNELDIF